MCIVRNDDSDDDDDDDDDDDEDSDEDSDEVREKKREARTHRRHRSNSSGRHRYTRLLAYSRNYCGGWVNL